ncbi:MAG TPA: hypothetical protein VLJ62_05300, partial [Burkholderiaceae bacterium]|nr:hypothetical protein [Burkholderiaceae bacterium]
SFDDDITIDLSDGLDTLTQAQKAALAAAERGDATVVGDVITIKRLRPVNVETGSGALTATAAGGSAFIGSESDLRIDKITATGDARIKAAGSLINAASVAGASNIETRNLILESATGGIGSIPDPVTGALSSPLRIHLSGVNDQLVARAAGDIWIETPVNLNVDTVFSRADVKLDAQGSILDIAETDPLAPELNIRSKNLTLIAQTGSIGAAANPLDVGVNADGLVFATASTPGQGVYLNAPSGEHFNIGSISSGSDITLSAANDLTVKGPVTAPGVIDLSAGGAMTLSTAADVHSTAGGVLLAAQTLTMEDNGTAAARVRSDTGTIGIDTVGNASITGIQTGNGTVDAVHITSTAGQILDAGDTRLDVIADTAPAATLTLNGHLGVGTLANPLELQLRNLDATSALGSVALDLTTGANINTVSAGDAVQIVAAGNITGNSVTSTGAGTQGSDKTVSVVSTGGSVTLASVSGTQDVGVQGKTGLDLGTVASSGGSVALGSSDGDVLVDTASAGVDVSITADLGNIDAGSVTAGQDATLTATAGSITSGVVHAIAGDATLSAAGDITATDTRAGQNVLITSAAGNLLLGAVVADIGNVTLNATLGNVAVDSATAGNNIRVTTPNGAIDAGVLVARGGGITLLANGDISVDSATARRDIVIESDRGTVQVDVLGTRGSFLLDTEGNIELGRITAGDAIELVSRSGSVSVDFGRAGSTLGIDARRAIEVGQLQAGDDLALVSRNAGISAESVVSRGGSASLLARGNIDLGTGEAAQTFFANSTTGNVSAERVSAETVDLNANGDLSARQI